jgi:exopolysaccharide biosynthesis predicted pyruvyltransferase EpsI
MLTVVDALDELRGKTVFFEPVGGNWGDALIEMGTRQVCARLGIKLDDKLAAGKNILINGSGSFGVELYHKKLERLRYYAENFPDNPIVMLPSSFDFQGNRVGELFQTRRAATVLFARELYSFAKLQTQTFLPNVNLSLDHDMAFHLRDSDFVRALRTRCRAEHVLLVERFDLETSSGAQPSYIPIALKIKNLLPPPVANSIRRWLHKKRTARTNFTAMALSRLDKEMPQCRSLPVLARDISAPGAFTFETFVDAIVCAAAVVTTRLHVGILAALLDKPTYLYTGNAPYPKIKSVYEYSMAEMQHVRLWDENVS